MLWGISSLRFSSVKLSFVRGAFYWSTAEESFSIWSKSSSLETFCSSMNDSSGNSSSSQPSTIWLYSDDRSLSVTKILSRFYSFCETNYSSSYFSSYLLASSNFTDCSNFFNSIFSIVSSSVSSLKSFFAFSISLCDYFNCYSNI